MNTFRELWFFARSFLRDKYVGSVVPTTRSIVCDVCEKMDFSTTCVVVELGPGTGCFTKEILRRMSPDSRLIVFETHVRFVELLRKWKDPRLTVVPATAFDLDVEMKALGITQIDSVLSGVPLSFFAKNLSEQLITDIHVLLRPGGALLVYQVRSNIEKYIQKVFGSMQRSFYFINIPPLYLWEAKKCITS